jgi:ribosomal protein S12 methylthiotransferase accessory factor
VSSISWYGGGPDDPHFVHCRGTVEAPKHNSKQVSAGGTALTEEVALAKAIGESLERYCANVYDPDAVNLTTYGKLGEKAIDPRRFVMFHPAQERKSWFPFATVTSESRLGWVEGFSLTRSQAAWVPAAMLHLTYRPLTSADRFEACPLSGYACGNTLEEAILRGLYEVVERDAFMIFWLHWLRVPGIDLTSLSDPETVETLGRFRDSPLWIFCSSITTDVGIPVALVGLTSCRPGWPATTVAMGADLSVEKAIGHALREMSANLLLVSSGLQYPRRPLPRSPGEVLEMEDHGLFYSSRCMLPALDPLLRPSQWVKAADVAPTHQLTDVKEDIEHCVKLLEDSGLEAIAVDITAPEVEEHGFKVVKVLIPGTQAIDFGPQWHLGGRRLYEAPVRMGYQEAARDPWHLNLFPHPFP